MDCYLWIISYYLYFWNSFCPTLYDGLKSCPQERHIHVLCDTDFIAHLIGRAEPEIAGGYVMVL
jgi:hypothetical protein